MAGDVWLWVAVDADSKLVPAWRVGDRTLDDGLRFHARLGASVIKCW